MTRSITPSPRDTGTPRKTSGSRTRKRPPTTKTSHLKTALRNHVTPVALTALGLLHLYLGLAGYSYGSVQIFGKYRSHNERGDYLIYEHDRVAAAGIYPFAADELVWFSLAFFFLFFATFYWAALSAAEKRPAKYRAQVLARRGRRDRVGLIGLISGLTLSVLGLALEVAWVATGTRYSNYLNQADASSYILPIIYFVFTGGMQAWLLLEWRRIVRNRALNGQLSRAPESREPGE